jgi:hypothetical protein
LQSEFANSYKAGEQQKLAAMAGELINEITNGKVIYSKLLGQNHFSGFSKPKLINLRAVVYFNHL